MSAAPRRRRRRTLSVLWLCCLATSTAAAQPPTEFDPDTGSRTPTVAPSALDPEAFAPDTESRTPTVAPSALDPEAFEDTLIPRPLKHARWSALVDGGWSVLMTVAWLVSARTWDTPQPDGLVSLLAVRVLYGTTHSVILAAQLSLFTKVFEDQWHRLSHGRIRNEWWVGANVPAGCAGRRRTGCGWGLGGYSELSVRVDGDLELALSGGWIQGRVDDDDDRTLIESTWVQAPAIARVLTEVGMGPFILTASAGGGIYFGLHVAHAHPRGERPQDVSPLELSILAGGIGVGASGRLRLRGPGGFRLEADLDLAPLVGYERDRVRPALAPVRPAGGMPVWRRYAVALGLPPIGEAPIRIAARFAMAELSSRPIHRAGHWAAVLSFEVPFVLDPPLEAPDIP